MTSLNQPESPSSEPLSAATINLDSLEDRWFRAVANYTHDWESWHALDGHLVWVNVAVERITGYSPAECLGMEEYPLPMVAPEDRAKISAALAQASRQTTGEDLEFRCYHKNGEQRWLSLAWQPMYDGNDNLGFRTSIRDVTERHNLREQLRIHANHLEQLVQERTARLRQLEQRQRHMEKLAALGQLAAGVAHEINNPLAGIRNAFQLIKSELTPDTENYELIELVDREIERISGIILQMYQLYRPSPQQSSTFRIAQAVRDVIYLLGASARKRDIQLVFESQDDEAIARLPEGELKQILYNLIRNAVQASDKGQVVNVELRASTKAIEISVQDHGPGISEEDLPNIFDPFFTTKHGHDETGMGLGLSVSRSIAEALGGRIDVVSVPTRGSRFTLVVPTDISNDDR